jgi:hypothetical protein
VGAAKSSVELVTHSFSPVVRLKSSASGSIALFCTAEVYPARNMPMFPKIATIVSVRVHLIPVHPSSRL